ncbi:hypothetical protein Bhyg_01773, partial [Pseudolycoriella hygida]
CIRLYQLSLTVIPSIQYCFPFSGNLPNPVSKSQYTENYIIVCRLDNTLGKRLRSSPRVTTRSIGQHPAQLEAW